MMRFDRAMVVAAALAVGVMAQAGLLDRKTEAALEEAHRSLHAGDFAKAGAYADLILMSKTMRVRLDLSGVSPLRQAECRNAVQGALEIWGEGLGEDLNVVFVDRGRSDVRIRYQSRVYYSGQVVAGRAIWSRTVQDWGFGQYTSQIKGDISLSLDHPEGRAMSPAEMRHTAAHEFGHILGMWDSPNTGDIMGPLTGADKLGEEEQAAMLDARSQADLISLYAQNELRAQAR